MKARFHRPLPVAGCRQPKAGGRSVTWAAVRHASAFTMIEVALCLAIIGFALVSILAVLPLGMNNQQKTREATMVSQDATLFLEAIRNGARGIDDLTNYVVAITNYYQAYNQLGRPSGPLHVAGYKYGSGTLDGAVQPGAGLTNGMRIIGLLSTPEFTAQTAYPNGFGGMPLAYTVGWNYFSNRVYAYVRSFSGMAAEKPPQDNGIMRDASFSYQVLCVNAPQMVDTNVLADHNAAFDQQMAGNLRQLWLLFRWPLLPNLTLPAIANRLDCRVDIAGTLNATNDLPDTNNFANSKGLWLYFYQSQVFTNTQVVP